MRAGPRPNRRAGSRRDGRPTCRRPASRRRCRGSRPSRRTTRPMHRPPPAPDCAPPHAANRLHPDRGASRGRGWMRSRDDFQIGLRLRRQVSRLADAKRPPHPKSTASSCATLQPRRIVSSIARRSRLHPHPRPGRFARRHARAPPGRGPRGDQLDTQRDPGRRPGFQAGSRRCLLQHEPSEQVNRYGDCDSHRDDARPTAPRRLDTWRWRYVSPARRHRHR